MLFVETSGDFVWIVGRVACSKRESFFGGGREGRWNGGKARGGIIHTQAQAAY